MISNESPDGPAGTASPLAPGHAGSALHGSAAALAARMRSLNAGVLREVALLPVLVLLLVVGAVVSPVFLTVSNIAGIGQQISALGVVVVGESLILMIGGMDLSLEATYGLAPMVAAWLILPVAPTAAALSSTPSSGCSSCSRSAPRSAWSMAC